MKIIIQLVLVGVSAFGGFLLGRSYSPRSASVQSMVAPRANAEPSPAPVAAQSSAGAKTEPTPDPAVPNSWQAPSEISADWVHAARAIDRRYGVLYRICALNPKEHELVRDLLTRESLLQAKELELQKKGLSAEQIASILAAERTRAADLQNQVNETMPEVAQLINEFKARPFAAATTSDVAERIMIETGTLSPNQMEEIFSAASVAEMDHPVPDFVNSLSFDGQNRKTLAVAADSLLERNKKFIPAACNVLDPAQVSAFMSYMEEQLLAVRNQAKAQ